MLPSKSIFPTSILFTILFIQGLLSGNTLMSQNRLTREQVNELSRAVVQVIVGDGTGSGSVVNGTNLIYTNRHVMQGFDTCTVAIIQNENKEAIPFFRAQLVSFSPDYDLAIIKIVSDLQGNEVSDEFLKNGNGDTFKGFPQLTFATDEESAQRGDEIALLGYPSIGEGELFYTRGVVSSVRYETFNGTELPAWYRTTAEMSVGNSGGIAVNENGHVIGMPTNVRTESQTGGRLGNILSMQVINAVVKNNNFLASWEDFRGADKNGHSLDFNLAPTFGEQILDSTFGATPLAIEVTSGGEVNSDYLQEGCTGFASSAPDVKMQWLGASEHLTLRFIPQEDSKDATLTVMLPDGSWMCNDDEDSETTNPAIVIDNPAQGFYYVWVGSYTEGDYITGTLNIIDPAKTNDIRKTHVVSNDLDYKSDPYFATMRFSSGFTPNPFTISGQTGGDIDIAKAGKGSECVGFVSKVPDFRLQWEGSTDNLHVSFRADSVEMDAVLVINTPEGTWICSDDTDELNLNPGLLLKGFKTGQFDIWIGSRKEGEYINGELIISELPSETISQPQLQP